MDKRKGALTRDEVNAKFRAGHRMWESTWEQVTVPAVTNYRIFRCDDHWRVDYWLYGTSTSRSIKYFDQETD